MRNLFVVIEEYLSNQTNKSLFKELMNISDKMAKHARNNFKEKSKDKKFEPEDLDTELAEIIKNEAQNSLNQAVRMSENQNTTHEENEKEKIIDDRFIFKVSEKEKKHIEDTILSREAGENYNNRALNIAFTFYMERRGTKETDAKYIEDVEETCFNYSSKIKRKAESLISRGFEEAGNALNTVSQSIIDEYKNNINNIQYNISVFSSNVKIILNEAKNTPAIKEHKEASAFIKNFLCLISLVGLIGLAATQKNRNSFWIKSETFEIDKLKNKIEEENPQLKN